MKEIEIKSQFLEAQMDELTPEEHSLIEQAIEGTNRSYSPYSHFHVGAALKLQNGMTFIGCNQENAAFPAGICAERSAIFSAGAQYPDQPITLLAIAARSKDGEFTKEPVRPCGTCRQVLIENETRFQHPIRILLYGQRCVYIVDSIKQLMPLSFTEF